MPTHSPSPEEQWDELNRMLFEQSAQEELTVRRIAKQTVCEPTLYAGGVNVPVVAAGEYHIINIKLSREWEGHFDERLFYIEDFVRRTLKEVWHESPSA